MRELKFRAWDKITKKMCEVLEMKNPFNYRQLSYRVYSEKWPSGSEIRSHDDVFLMQYTGLKDKNGREIYEGDVVEDVFFRDVRKYEVKFDINRAGFIPFVNDDGCGCCASDGMGLRAEDIVVVGNVFENPELLGDVK